MAPVNVVKHFQYLVVGGGSGGIASARRAAEFGVSVGLIEKQALGGTCVSIQNYLDCFNNWIFCFNRIKTFIFCFEGKCGLCSKEDHVSSCHAC